METMTKGQEAQTGERAPERGADNMKKQVCHPMGSQTTTANQGIERNIGINAEKTNHTKRERKNKKARSHS